MAVQDRGRFAEEACCLLCCGHCYHSSRRARSRMDEAVVDHNSSSICAKNAHKRCLGRVVVVVVKQGETAHGWYKVSGVDTSGTCVTTGRRRTEE